MFARYGGEEFALLLPETEQWHALQIAEKLQHRIEQQEIFFDGMRLRVTLSLGAAEASAEMLSPEQLIQTADSHLYHAKRTGRNRVCGWPA
jgi:diguanylate cyclase (GGDEF)-like protein